MTSGEFVIGGSLRRNSVSFEKSRGGREGGGSESHDDVLDPSPSSSSPAAELNDAAALRAAAAALALRRFIWAFVRAGSPSAATGGEGEGIDGGPAAAPSPPLPLLFPDFLEAAAPPLPPFASSSPAISAAMLASARALAASTKFWI